MDWLSPFPIGRPAVDPNAPVFTATTDCPIPTDWILLAFAGGLVAGYLLWKR